jgi:voltage-gated potassium channel
MTAGQQREQRLEAWKARTEWPLALAAAAFLVAYAWPILDPTLSPALRAACRATTWVAWGLFALDYAGRLAVAEDRFRFFKHHLFDLAVIVLPLLRPLRLLRLVVLLKVLNRTAVSGLRGRIVVYVVGATGLIVAVSGLAVLDAERRGGVDPNITSYADALWWAFVTVTTVGYGDLYPTSPTGRFVAVGLMIAGIALVGVVTATFASWLVEKVKSEGQETQDDVAALTAEVRRLHAKLDRLSEGEQESERGSAARS